MSNLSVSEISNFIDNFSSNYESKDLFSLSNIFEESSFLIKSRILNEHHDLLVSKLKNLFCSLLSEKHSPRFGVPSFLYEPKSFERLEIDTVFECIDNYFGLSKVISSGSLLNDFFWRNISEISDYEVLRFKNHTKPRIMEFYSELRGMTDGEMPDSYGIPLNVLNTYFSGLFDDKVFFSSLENIILKIDEKSFIYVDKNQILFSLNGCVYSISRSLQSDKLNNHSTCKNIYVYSTIFLIDFKVKSDGSLLNLNKKDNKISGITSVFKTENYFIHLSRSSDRNNNLFSIFNDYLISFVGFVNGNFSYIVIDENNWNIPPVIISGKEHFPSFRIINSDSGILLEGDFFSKELLPFHMSGQSYSLSSHMEENFKKEMNSRGISFKEPSGSRYYLDSIYSCDFESLIENKIDFIIK